MAGVLRSTVSRRFLIHTGTRLQQVRMTATTGDERRTRVTQIYRIVVVRFESNIEQKCCSEEEGQVIFVTLRQHSY